MFRFLYFEISKMLFNLIILATLTDGLVIKKKYLIPVCIELSGNCCPGCAISFFRLRPVSFPVQSPWNIIFSVYVKLFWILILLSFNFACRNTRIKRYRIHRWEFIKERNHDLKTCFINYHLRMIKIVFCIIIYDSTCLQARCSWKKNLIITSIDLLFFYCRT